ncbi:MAG: hypothetical protein ACRDYA_06605 [Egibacteraceae bacterium]
MDPARGLARRFGGEAGPGRDRPLAASALGRRGSWVSGTVEGVAGVLRIERENPLIVSCAACGGVTQLCGYGPVELLPWKVIEHWLTVHWDRAGLDDEGAGR